MKRKGETADRVEVVGERTGGWPGDGIPPMTFLSEAMTRYHVMRSMHPRFAVGLSDSCDRTGNELRDRINARYVNEMLALRRQYVYEAVEKGTLTADLLLDREVAEVRAALVRDDGAGAVKGCYGAIAVLMRMIDVIEGRQSLGKAEDCGC